VALASTTVTTDEARLDGTGLSLEVAADETIFEASAVALLRRTHAGGSFQQRRPSSRRRTPASASS